MLATALFMAMLACSHAKKVVNIATLRPGPLNLNVAIDPAANGNSPVALDVALVKDKNLWKTAQAMAAKDWFAQRSDLERRYRAKLEVHSWEWVPGQEVQPITINVPRRFSGAMVFADYPSPGTHSAPIPLGGSVTISLQQNDFIVVAKP